MTLVEFLLARIAEDEAVARECKEWSDCFACPTHERFDTRRVLAEREAQRRIIEEIGHPLFNHGSRGYILRVLALPYADHPDYREEWKP